MNSLVFYLASLFVVFFESWLCRIHFTKIQESFSDESLQKMNCSESFWEFMDKNASIFETNLATPCIPPRSDFYSRYSSQEAPPSLCWLLHGEQHYVATLSDGTERLFSCLKN